jgi:hypothetical protein
MYYFLRNFDLVSDTGFVSSLLGDNITLWNCLSPLNVKPRLSNIEMLKKPYQVSYPSLLTWEPPKHLLDSSNLHDRVLKHLMKDKNKDDNGSLFGDNSHTGDPDEIPVTWRINSLNGSNR